MGTRVRLTRSGGFAGLSMVASVDLDELPEETAAEVKAALDGLDFDKPAGRRRRGPARAPAAPSGFGAGAADTFQYDLEVIGEKRQSLTVHEPLRSPQLQTLVDALLPLAEPE
jgi:hypothetical protein